MQKNNETEQFTYTTLRVLNNSAAQERKAKIKELKYQLFLDFKTNPKRKSPVGFLKAAQFTLLRTSVSNCP